MPAESTRSRISATAAPADTDRVRVVQVEATKALRLALAFAVAGAAAVVVPHTTGAWLPLHLFLVGSLGLAISGATRLFAVTWSAGRPTHPKTVVTQRWLLAAGAAGLALGREVDAPAPVVATAGLCVTAALALLGFLLVTDVRDARVQRFRPALRYYLTAIATGLVGTGLGAAMVTGHARLRDAHVALNLLGFLGLVIAGTLPTFMATQARTKMSSRATPRRLAGNLVWLTTTLALASLGALAGWDELEAAGLLGYAVGLLHVLTLLPPPGRKQLDWAGPRLLQLGAGMVWWVVILTVAAWNAVRGEAAFPERLVVALVIGGYAQILVASLAYLGPVLRGGGHRRLSRGFALTRSWTALVLSNVAVVAWLAGGDQVAGIAVMAVALDVSIRAARLSLRAEPAQAVGV